MPAAIQVTARYLLWKGRDLKRSATMGRHVDRITTRTAACDKKMNERAKMPWYWSIHSSCPASSRCVGSVLVTRCTPGTLSELPTYSLPDTSALRIGIHPESQPHRARIHRGACCIPDASEDRRSGETEEVRLPGQRWLARS